MLRKAVMDIKSRDITVTAAVIVKDEERSISRCINSLLPLFNERYDLFQRLHIDAPLSFYLDETEIIKQARKLILSIRASGYNTVPMDKY